MKRRDRNSYRNVACRRLMRCQRRIAYARLQFGIVGLVLQRMAEAELQALRFAYGQLSIWGKFPVRDLRDAVNGTER